MLNAVFVLAARLDYLEDPALEISHGRVTPDPRVPVEICRETLLAGKMQPDDAIVQRF
jgi:hypothetical protein